MKEKPLKVTIDSTYNYIRLFNGLMDLTDMEMTILAEFIDLKRSLDEAGIDGINPFSMELRKKVAERLGRDNYSTLNTYIKSLKEKGAITKLEDKYEINSILIPTGEKEKIIFVVTNE